MLAAITGLLSSIPQLLTLGQNIWAWLQKISGGDVAGFIGKTNDAFILLNNAKTEDDMIAAAKAIQAAIRGTR